MHSFDSRRSRGEIVQRFVDAKSTGLKDTAWLIRIFKFNVLLVRISRKMNEQLRISLSTSFTSMLSSLKLLLQAQIPGNSQESQAPKLHDITLRGTAPRRRR
jgi:hypothetical protein